MDDIDHFLKEDVGEKGDITSDSLFTTEQAYAEIIAQEGNAQARDCGAEDRHHVGPVRRAGQTRPADRRDEETARYCRTKGSTGA